MKLSCLLLPNATKRNSQFQITLFCSQVHFLSSVFLELPVTVAQGADVPGLEPPGDAVEVEGVVAHPPSHGAFFTGGAGLYIIVSKNQFFSATFYNPSIT